MNIGKVALPLGVVLVGLALVLQVSGQSDGIIVDGADATTTLAVTGSPDLNTLMAGVGPRFVIQYANELRPISLITVPASLQTLLGQVSPRIVIQYANANREDALVVIPGTLQTLLGQVPDRIVIQYANTNRQDALVVIPSTLQTLLGQVSDRIVLQYANTNRHLQLAYPAALINDTAPPQCSGLIASTRGIGTVTIAWATDEFATSTVLYGTQPGIYSQTVSDPLYTKQHKITLTGLPPGTMPYYYVVRSTDRSGNTATSAEHSFNAQPFFYLPLIMRRSP